MRDHPNAAVGADGCYAREMLRLVARAFVVCGLALVAAPASAYAEPAQAQAPEQLAKDASDAYKRGEFKRAAELYEAAYAVSKEPVLLFNLGRCHEALGSAADLREAIARYRAYLAAASGTADTPAVTRRIETLEQQVEILERPPEQQTIAPPPPPERPAVLPWIIVGAGSAGLTIGIVLGALAEGGRADAQDEPVAVQGALLADEAEGFALAANVLFGVAGALTLAGGIWGVVDLATLRSGPTVTASVRPTGAALAISF